MSKSVNAKLHEVLKEIGEINKRMDKLNQRLDNLETRLNNIEHTLNERIVNVEKQMTNKIDASVVAEFEKRIAILEYKEEDRQAEAVMKESYEKRLNIVIHGLEEDRNLAWETRQETLKITHRFMREGLHIENPSRFVFADYHRLPQRLLYKNRQKVDRPVIIKLTSAADKHEIFAHLRNLKSHNAARKVLNSKVQYVTQHLPKLFEERKQRMPFFKSARLQKKSTQWGAEQGHYLLYVNNKKVNLPADESHNETNTDTSDSEA